MTRPAFRAALFALALSTTPAGAQRSARRVVDASGIAAAGWHHLSDIVDALPPGSAASTDGFNYMLSGSRIGFVEASASGARWMVRLDGQAMPVAFEGLSLLDAIPVAITQIDSIVITEGPGVVDGRTTFLGTIDLYTRQPRRGPSAVVDYQHGDESGDPGPYRYTARNSPNVEKLGPFASGAVAMAGSRAAVDIAARYSSLNITDARIASRFPAVSGRLQTDVNASGGSGIVTGRFAGGQHRLIAGRGRFTGLMYLPASGLDRSARVIASHAGVSGNVRANGLALRYAATVTALEVDSLGDILPFGLQQDRVIGDAFVEAGGNAAAFRFGAGANVGRQERTAADSSTTTAQRATERVWITYAKSARSATVGLQHEAGGLRASLSARAERELAKSRQLAMTVVAFNSWVDADNAWMDAFRSPVEHGASNRAADVRVDLTTRRIANILPNWYARGFVFSGLRASGSDAGIAGGVVASGDIGTHSTFAVRAELSERLGGTAADAGSTPGGFVEAGATTITPGRFRIALSGRYAPRRHWPPLEPDAITSVPEIRRVDFSVNKPLWHDRVRAQLVIRNALNQPEITHPLGAQWNLRTHLAVTVWLPGVSTGDGR
jgi:hypothetical protein